MNELLSFISNQSLALFIGFCVIFALVGVLSFGNRRY